MATCHKGHKLEFKGHQYSFCDCGEAGGVSKRRRCGHVRRWDESLHQFSPNTRCDTSLGSAHGTTAPQQRAAVAAPPTSDALLPATASAQESSGGRSQRSANATNELVRSDGIQVQAPGDSAAAENSQRGSTEHSSAEQVSTGQGSAEQGSTQDWYGVFESDSFDYLEESVSADSAGPEMLPTRKLSGNDGIFRPGSFRSNDRKSKESGALNARGSTIGAGDAEGESKESPSVQFEIVSAQDVYVCISLEKLNRAKSAPQSTLDAKQSPSTRPKPKLSALSRSDSPRAPKRNPIALDESKRKHLTAHLGKVLQRMKNPASQRSDRKSTPARPREADRTRPASRRGSRTNRGRPSSDQLWNGPFQAAQREQNYSKLHQLFVDFVSMSCMYGRTIVREKDLPDAEKTVRPLDSVGGVAGGRKYLVDGILFKLCSDTKVKPKIFLYGGRAENYECAAKSAGHEIKGANAYMRAFRKMSASGDMANVQMQVPFQVMLDYGGHRMIAMPWLPLNRVFRAPVTQRPTSIVYGLDSKEMSVHDGSGRHPHVAEAMRRAAREMHIAEHSVHGRRLAAAGDVEVHLGKDRALYVLDLARTLPSECPAQASHLPSLGRQAIFFRLMRPELLARLQAGRTTPPLSPDAFSGFSRDPRPQACVERRQLEEASTTATSYLVETVIPGFARLVDAGTVTLREPVSAALHREGINCRHIGLLRSLVRDPAARDTLLVEAVARTLKQLLRRRLRLTDLRSEYTMRARMVKFFNRAVNSPGFWESKVQPGVVERFGRCALVAPDAPQSGVIGGAELHRRCREPGGLLLRIIRYLIASARIRPTPESLGDLEGSLASGGTFAFHHVDFTETEVRVKAVSILDYAEGRMLAAGAMDHARSCRTSGGTQRTRGDSERARTKRLLLLAKAAFERVLQTDSRDFMARVNWCWMAAMSHEVQGQLKDADNVVLTTAANAATPITRAWCLSLLGRLWSGRLPTRSFLRIWAGAASYSNFERALVVARAVVADGIDRELSSVISRSTLDAVQRCTADILRAHRERESWSRELDKVLLTRGPVEFAKTHARWVRDGSPHALLLAEAMNSCATLYANQHLHLALRHHNADLVALLLHMGASDAHAPVDKDQDQKRPIHFSYTNTKILSNLLDSGAEIDGADAAGRTCLHYIAMDSPTNGTVAFDGIKRILVTLPTSFINARDKSGKSALHLAARQGREDIVVRLIGASADTEAQCTKGNTPLHYAARGGSKAVARRLLESGTETGLVNAQKQTWLDVADTRVLCWATRDPLVVEASLCAAIDGRSSNELKALVSAGVGLDGVSAPIVTRALVHTARYDLVFLGRWLLAKGADPSAPDPLGLRPLPTAVTQEASAMVRYLVRAKADVDAPDEQAENGGTILHRAFAYQGGANVAIVEELLRGTRCPNARNRLGQTPLHLGVRTGNPFLVKKILDSGASTGIQDGQGQTALDYCERFVDKDDARGLIRSILEGQSKESNAEANVTT